MDLKLALAVICGVLAIGGGAVMKVVFSNQAERDRGVSFWEAFVGTGWLRDARGRFRWVVPAWVIFWFVAAYLTSAPR